MPSTLSKAPPHPAPSLEPSPEQGGASRPRLRRRQQRLRPGQVPAGALLQEARSARSPRGLPLSPGLDRGDGVSAPEQGGGCGLLPVVPARRAPREGQAGLAAVVTSWAGHPAVWVAPCWAECHQDELGPWSRLLCWGPSP